MAHVTRENGPFSVLEPINWNGNEQLENELGKLCSNNLNKQNSLNWFPTADFRRNFSESRKYKIFITFEPSLDQTL